MQPPQYVEVEHQSLNSDLLESGQDSGLGAPSSSAVFYSPRTLPQTWTQRYNKSAKVFDFFFFFKKKKSHLKQFILIQPRSPSLVRTSPYGDLWSWWRSCVRSLPTSPRVPETFQALSGSLETVFCFYIKTAKICIFIVCIFLNFI